MTISKHIRRLGSVAAVAIAALAWASPAPADMVLTITDAHNPGDTQTIDDMGSGDAIFSGTVGNFKITSIVASVNYDGNTDGNANFGDANILTAVTRVTQTGTAGGMTDSLIIQVTTSGSSSWSAPGGNTVRLSSTNSVSRLDGSNGTPGGSSSTFASTFASGIAHSVVIAPTAYSAVTTTNSELTSNPSPPFYLSNILTINTKGRNEVVNLSASTDVTAVPEPSTALLALVGGLLMVAFGWRQRRGAD